MTKLVRMDHRPATCVQDVTSPWISEWDDICTAGGGITQGNKNKNNSCTLLVNSSSVPCAVTSFSRKAWPALVNVEILAATASATAYHTSQKLFTVQGGSLENKIALIHVHAAQDNLPELFLRAEISGACGVVFLTTLSSSQEHNKIGSHSNKAVQETGHHPTGGQKPMSSSLSRPALCVGGVRIGTWILGTELIAADFGLDIREWPTLREHQMATVGNLTSHTRQLRSKVAIVHPSVPWTVSELIELEIAGAAAIILPVLESGEDVASTLYVQRVNTRNRVLKVPVLFASQSICSKLLLSELVNPAVSIFGNVDAVSIPAVLVNSADATEQLLETLQPDPDTSITCTLKGVPQYYIKHGTVVPSHCFTKLAREITLVISGVRIQAQSVNNSPASWADCLLKGNDVELMHRQAELVTSKGIKLMPWVFPLDFSSLDGNGLHLTQISSISQLRSTHFSGGIALIGSIPEIPLPQQAILAHKRGARFVFFTILTDDFDGMLSMLYSFYLLHLYQASASIFDQISFPCGCVVISHDEASRLNQSSICRIKEIEISYRHKVMVVPRLRSKDRLQTAVEHCARMHCAGILIVNNRSDVDVFQPRQVTLQTPIQVPTCLISAKHGKLLIDNECSKIAGSINVNNEIHYFSGTSAQTERVRSVGLWKPVLCVLYMLSLGVLGLGWWLWFDATPAFNVAKSFAAVATVVISWCCCCIPVSAPCPSSSWVWDRVWGT